MNNLIMLLSEHQPRRIRVIENVLVNKRTVATLYWGMRYQLLDWLGAKRHTSQAAFVAQWQALQTAGLITLVEHQAQLTPAGVIAQEQWRSTHYQPRFQTTYLQVDVPRWISRFLLAAQVVSEYSYGNRRYAPFSFDETELRLVKQWFSAQNKAQLVDRYRQELTGYLAQLSTSEADFIVSQLIGHQQAGESLVQLAQRFAITPEDAWLMQYDLFAGLAQTVLRQPDGVLAGLLRPLRISTQLSASAVQTYGLFQQGVPLAQISQQRRLKPGTVREHLLEAAIFESHFPYARLLSPAAIATLESRYEALPIDDWQFQAQTSDSATEFFLFRLFQIMRSKTGDNHTTATH